MSVDQRPGRRLLARALGGIAGALVGLVGNYLPYRWVTAAGGSYPVEPTTMVAVAIGILLGVEAADRLGKRAAPVLAAVLGVFLALAIGLLAR